MGCPSSIAWLKSVHRSSLILVGLEQKNCRDTRVGALQLQVGFDHVRLDRACGTYRVHIILHSKKSTFHNRSQAIQVHPYAAVVEILLERNFANSPRTQLTGDPSGKKSGKEKVARVKVDTPKLILRNDDNPLWQKQANQPNMRTFKPVRTSIEHAILRGLMYITGAR